MQARIDGRKIHLLTRKKLDWTERFLSIADALRALCLGSALIDGEIVVEDASGISSFNDLQADLKAGRLDRFRYFVFDVLYCEGFDLTKAALKDRKNLLQQLLAILPPGSPIRFSEHLDVDGPTMLEHACRFGLEGIVSKRADLPYRSGRGDHWLKSKCLERQEFIILGYIPSTAASRSVGSLALGYHDNQNLAYAGRVGTGWSQEQARMLRDELEAIRATKPSFAKSLPAGTEKGVVEIHPWGSTIDHLEQPDRLVFDLDPGENVPWEVVIDAAYDVRDRLATIGLQSFVKTSGGKGLHIVAPVQPEADWDEVKMFTKAVAGTMAKDRPNRYVVAVAKSARHARIFVDYLRNDRGATAVALFDACIAAGIGFDTPQLGGTSTRTLFRPLHSRKRAAPAFIS
jgi:DNA ligase D-like protein (predicted ligase)